jgi:hypothetical protein
LGIYSHGEKYTRYHGRITRGEYDNKKEKEEYLNYFKEMAQKELDRSLKYKDKPEDRKHYMRFISQASDWSKLYKLLEKRSVK